MPKFASLAILQSGEATAQTRVNSATVASGCALARDGGTLVVTAILDDTGQMSAAAATCFAALASVAVPPVISGGTPQPNPTVRLT